MTWSLQLRNGDLSLGGASYGTVTGEDKLAQDLRCFILEQMGTDDMHLDYGSTLNGGRMPDGTLVPGVIGHATNDEFAELEVESELRRIIGQYQARQLQRAKDDRLVYGKTTLHRGEVVLGVRSIAIQRTVDTMNVTITIETAADSLVTLGLEV